MRTLNITFYTVIAALASIMVLGFTSCDESAAKDLALSEFRAQSGTLARTVTNTYVDRQVLSKPLSVEPIVHSTADTLMVDSVKQTYQELVVTKVYINYTFIAFGCVCNDIDSFYVNTDKEIVSRDPELAANSIRRLTELKSLSFPVQITKRWTLYTTKLVSRRDTQIKLYTEPLTVGKYYYASRLGLYGGPIYRVASQKETPYLEQEYKVIGDRKQRSFSDWFYNVD